MNEIMQKCLEAARLIVAAEHALWPGCDDAVAILSGGGSGSSQDSKFARQGTSENAANYQGLPAYLTDLIGDNARSTDNDPALSPLQTSLFSDLMTRTPSDLPGVGTLDSNMAISPTSFTGSSTLSTIAARDPYSSQFETDTQDAYEQRASDAMAQAATGPDAVRGGSARTGIAQGVMADRLAQGRGEEVRKAQTQDAGIVGMAGQMFNQIEGQRRGVQLGSQQQKAEQSLQQDDNALGAARVVDNRKVSNLGALQLASDLLGTKKGLSTDNLTGKGAQTNHGWNAGVSL